MHTFSSRQVTLVGLLDMAGVLAISGSALLGAPAQGILSTRSHNIQVSGHTQLAHAQLMTVQGVVHANFTEYRMPHARLRFSRITKGLDGPSGSFSFPSSGRKHQHYGLPHRNLHSHTQLQEDITHSIQQSLSFPLFSAAKKLAQRVSYINER